MKNLYFAVFTALLLVCLPTWTRAQGPGFNYYEVVAQKDRYFDSLRSITPDTVKIPVRCAA